MTNQETKLLQILKTIIEYVGESVLFELNDEKIQATVTNRLNVIFKALQDSLVFNDFVVICDGSNNNENVIKSNQLIITTAFQLNEDAQFTMINVVIK